MLKQFYESLGNLAKKLEEWFNDIIVMLPNLILAAVIMVLAIFASRYISKYVGKVMNRFTHNKTVSSVVSSIATAVSILIALFIVLGVLGLDTALTSLLASAGVLGLAVGLALQDPLINLFSGIIMSVRRLYNIGDLVETNGYFGNIQKISLRSTIIRLKDGPEVVIPNKTVIQEPLKNYSITSERRVAVECGVSYGDDLDKVKSVVVDAIKKNIEYNKNREVDFFYTSFGDSSINFVVRFWMNETEQKTYLHAKSEAIIALKKALDKNDIAIPFPIRTLDFGVKGGEKINEVIPFEKFTVQQNSKKNGQEAKILK